MSLDKDEALLYNTLPNSDDAERAALGAALSSQQAAKIVTETLTQENFYNSSHKLIYTYIREFLRDYPTYTIDPLNFKNYLEEKGKLEECGGINYIAQLMDSAPSALNVESYINIVRDRAIRRDIINACDQAKSDVIDLKNDEKVVLDELIHSLVNVSAGGKEDFIDLKDTINDEEKRFEARLGKKIQHGVKTGLARLDRIINGFKPGQLVIVSARPGVGKTSFVISCILNMTRETISQFEVDEDGFEKEYRKTVVPGFFSLEMNSTEITYRMLSSISRVEAKKISNYTVERDSREYEALRDAFGYLFEHSIKFESPGVLHLHELAAQCRKMKRAGVDIIFIDYLSLLATEDLGNRNSSMSEKVGIVTRTLKLLAGELQIPIVLLVQLNREAESSVPTMANLRDSGSIEQDADIIIFLHNPDRNKLVDQSKKDYSGDEDMSSMPASVTDEGYRTQRIVTIVAKHRNGGTGQFDLCFIPSIMTYTNYEEEY